MVPVTATAVSGNGAKNLRGEPRERAARGLSSAMWTAPSTVASGRATTATAPAATAAGDEILAVDPRALERAEDRAGRDLAVVDREAGDAGVAAAGHRAPSFIRDPPSIAAFRPGAARSAAAAR